MGGVLPIRAAVIADYERLRVLWKNVDDLHRQALPHMFREPSESWPDHATVEALIAGPDSTILVVEEDIAVAGFITLLMCRRPQTPIRPSRTYVEIDNMAVDPSKRGRGIGRVLMDAATVWATQQGAQRLELNVYEFNEAASRLYGSTGFVTVSRRLIREISRPKQK